MPKLDVEKIRNVILLAHNGAGKTSLVESMLFNAGATTRMGTVDEGNTVTDFEPEEIERHMSISSSLAFCEYKNTWFNLIDTPGFNNFLEESRGGIRAADGVLLIATATEGVKPETIKLWSYANEFNIPAMIFINKIDKEHADFNMAMKAIQDSFELPTLPLSIPIGQANDFRGIIDVVNLKAYKFTNQKAEEIPIPEDQQDIVNKYRTKLIETAAESNDALIEKYFAGKELTHDEITQGIHVGAKNKKFLPVLCGSAINNQGVRFLMDAISFCIPSPGERPDISPIKGKNPKDDSEIERKPMANEPFAAFVFKTIADPFAGQLSLFRVISGELKSDTTVLNSSKGSKERMGHISHLQGKKQVEVDVLGPGEIGVVAKLKETQTGDTLCDALKPIVFDKITFANALISFAIKPKTKSDEEKVSVGLHKIVDEDPTLDFHREEESHDMILAGMGQLHVEVALQKLKRKFGVNVEMQAPKIPYRETIRGTAKVQGKYKKQSGGKGQYGDCWIEIKPLLGEDFKFVDNIVGGSIPRQYIPAVEKGIVERMKQGVVAGYHMIGVEVSLFDGSFHAVDSSEMAFKIAGSMAFKAAAEKANPVLLEPVMKVEIVVPEETMGTVIGDLNSKRAKVDGMEPVSKHAQKVIAEVPMAEMITYANQLSSITSGRGVYTMEFLAYEEVPAHVAQKVIEESKKAKETIAH